MVLLSVYTLYVILFAVLMSALSTLVWGIHWYPYLEQSRRATGRQIRQFYESGGLWSILVNGYTPYDRGSGKVSKDYKGRPIKLARPMRGFLISGLLTIVLIAGALLTIIAMELFFSITEMTSVWIYCSFIFVFLCIVFPDFFVKYANLPGRLREIPQDLPHSPMWWGALVAVYTAGVLLKMHVGIDIFEPILDNVLPNILGHKIGILGIPFLWLGIIIGGTKIYFGRDTPHYSVWVIFFISWFISLAACFVLGILLL